MNMKESKVKIQTYTCEECENDMAVDMYARTPWKGILLRCDECDREIGLEGEHEEIIV